MRKLARPGWTALAVSGVAATGLVVTAAPTAAWAAFGSGTPVTFVVNSTTDRPDATVNGVCQTSLRGECTLRAALMEADAATGPVTIDFDIPGSGLQTIAPKRVLPYVDNPKEPITINGFSQPGSTPNTDPLVDNAQRMIQVVGPDTGSGYDGLKITGHNNVVRGLIMHGFPAEIIITGSGAYKNVIEGDMLGLMPDGSLDPNYVKYGRILGDDCLEINSSNANHIGEPGNANRNVISGCYNTGISLNNQHTGDNVVQNNIIGLDPTGTLRRPNEGHGVDHNWAVTGTLVGGTGYEQRNVISGNHLDGVEISHGVTNNKNSVIGNFIGTDPTGNNATPADRNSQYGVHLEGKPNCNNKPCPAEEGYETVEDNVIVNSGAGGVTVDKGVHDSVIADNRIGVTLNGTVSSNGPWGVMIAAGETHITVGPGNIITGNAHGIMGTPLGIEPVSAVPSPTEDNTITQNSIYGNQHPIAIDWLPYGQVNQNGDGDPNFNQGINVPVLSTASGRVRARACAGCTVELYASSQAAGSPGSGRTYLATAVANTKGIAVFSTPSGGWPAVVTATATTPQGSTSEFATGIAPPA